MNKLLDELNKGISKDDDMDKLASQYANSINECDKHFDYDEAMKELSKSDEEIAELMKPDGRKVI